MTITRSAVVPAILALVLAGSASAQFRPPAVPPKAAAGEMKYFRVTLTNQSDVTVIFTMQWEGKTEEKVTLDPGKKIVAEIKQPPAPKKPRLTVTFKPGPRVKDEEDSLESGHIDPRTNNPGIIYDFQKLDTNLGRIIVLKPR